MARSLRIQYPEAYYHVTCRGNERKEIFSDDFDRKLFLEKLAVSLEGYNVNLIAFVCMVNHFHLLVNTPDGNLADFMRHFNICYTSAFNRRHNRVGHLYQGRYKAFLIDADNYLLAVSRYVHLNPVRAGGYAEHSTQEKWEMLLQHKFSSLRGYLSIGNRKGFVSYESVLGYLGGDTPGGRKAYRQFMKRGLGGEIENPLDLGKGKGIVGEGDFVAKIKSEILEATMSAREQPALRALQRANSPEELISRFASMIGKEREEICKRGKNSVERAMLMELLYRLCKITQPEIGRIAGIDYSAVSQARRRLKDRLEQDKKLKRNFDELQRRLQKS